MRRGSRTAPTVAMRCPTHSPDRPLPPCARSPRDRGCDRAVTPPTLSPVGAQVDPGGRTALDSRTSPPGRRRRAAGGGVGGDVPGVPARRPRSEGLDLPLHPDVLRRTLVHVDSRPESSCRDPRLRAAVRAARYTFPPSSDGRRRGAQPPGVRPGGPAPHRPESAAEPTAAPDPEGRVRRRGTDDRAVPPPVPGPRPLERRFRPLQSPVPLLAIREMISSDLPFLIGSPPTPTSTSSAMPGHPGPHPAASWSTGSSRPTGTAVTRARPAPTTGPRPTPRCRTPWTPGGTVDARPPRRPGRARPVAADVAASRVRSRRHHEDPPGHPPPGDRTPTHWWWSRSTPGWTPTPSPGARVGAGRTGRPRELAEAPDSRRRGVTPRLALGGGPEARSWPVPASWSAPAARIEIAIGPRVCPAIAGRVARRRRGPPGRARRLGGGPGRGVPRSRTAVGTPWRVRCTQNLLARRAQQEDPMTTRPAHVRPTGPRRTPPSWTW